MIHNKGMAAVDSICSVDYRNADDHSGINGKRTIN